MQWPTCFSTQYRILRSVSTMRFSKVSAVHHACAPILDREKYVCRPITRIAEVHSWTYIIYAKSLCSLGILCQTKLRGAMSS